jgi:hypothetical protein
MKDRVFHVYKKGTNDVQLHSLSVDELEDAIKTEQIKFGEIEIEPLTVERDEEASY